MEKILEVRDLRKTYGDKESAVKALDGIDLDIFEGELLVILGSSGSGKSTLLNLLGGMDQPDGGSIWFRGKEISHLKDRDLTKYRKNNVGFVFQAFNLIGEMTVYENVALTADAKKDPQIVDHVLELVGIQDKKKKYPSHLSGGEQQRVAIARALAGKADMLLCDEPTGALDYETGKQILAELETLSRKHKKTVLIVTHTKEIAQMGDRVITMRDGKIVSVTENESPVSVERIEW
ncbi:MAG: ABC transporter ATP-binding protein [Lachnospiraceae bacterium]|nr:ABC transporter ATP-binding protein [Lachnospiraceae bacterium]MBQ2100220.1 ABC transporter ATP-binding protein [Lachnospiraceae bacterium]